MKYILCLFCIGNCAICTHSLYNLHSQFGIVFFGFFNLVLSSEETSFLTYISVIITHILHITNHAGPFILVQWSELMYSVIFNYRQYSSQSTHCAHKSKSGSYPQKQRAELGIQRVLLIPQLSVTSILKSQ